MQERCREKIFSVRDRDFTVRLHRDIYHPNSLSPAMSTKVGRPIVVGDVISKSISLLRQRPALLIPQVIVLVLSLIGDLASAATFSALGAVILFITVVVWVVIAGAYPSLIKEALTGGQITIAESMRHAARRFITLLVAGILVGLLVFVGFIALVVPGIIFITWYAYTVPAIMLENKGPLAGMSASRAFGRDKKWKTFLLALVAIIAVLIVAAIQSGISSVSPIAGSVVYSVLLVPVDAWIAVMLTYTYITYGPSSTPPTGEASMFGASVPPAPSMVDNQGSPAAPVAAPGRMRFCSNCGSQVQADAMFCPNCGKILASG